MRCTHHTTPHSLQGLETHPPGGTQPPFAIYPSVSCFLNLHTQAFTYPRVLQTHFYTTQSFFHLTAASPKGHVYNDFLINKLNHVTFMVGRGAG